MFVCTSWTAQVINEGLLGKKKKRLFLPCKHQIHQDSGRAPRWWATEKEQSKRWRRSARLQTDSACHSSQPYSPDPAAPRGADQISVLITSQCLFQVVGQFVIKKQRLKQFENIFWKESKTLRVWVKCCTYWDREGFILVVKGHVSCVASLGQHAIKVVLTASWEVSEIQKR